ncbi:PREDICTED: protein sidekick-like, partial [Nicrophorus vespilloides]|uniref:Protein sidekick-like n=1 Tax=Nicrophorus vespilloides TaxID=110193 RepID=A0ABM1MTD7_NICVS
NLQAPRFTTSSSTSSIIRLGTTKIMQCQAFGYPQPQYRWMKDGVLITDLSTESFYKIFHTRLEDEGSYRCIASNKVGSIMSEETKVVVAYMGVFENQTETSVSVKAGQAAILDLPYIESSPEPEIIWQTDEGLLMYSQKYTKSKTNQLIILSTESNDEQAYRARAMNTQEGKEENSAYIRLNVIEDDNGGSEIAPEIIINPQDVEIIKGADQTTLDCIANARPLHELQTLWYKDGIIMESSGIQYTFNDVWNRSLTLISANLTHTGVYECQVSLKTGGFPPVKAAANVRVLERPRFVSNTRTESLGEYGTQISLPCDVVGIPKPNITWYRNTVNIETLNDTRYQIEEDNSLFIRKLSIQDMGMYQCFARNQAGESYMSTWLKVKTAVPVMEVGPQNSTVLDGKDVTVNCQAAGAPEPNITWIFNEQEEVEMSGRFQKLENGDLLIAAVREADAGLYTCIRANEAGKVTGSAHITVLVRTQIIHPPAPTRVLLGHTATLQCKVSSDPTVPYHLHWYHNN